MYHWIWHWSNKKSPSFWPICQKPLFLNGKLSPVIQTSNFSCKISISWPMVQKDGDFWFWSTSIVTFLGLKKSHSLRSVFLDHSLLGFSVQSNVTDWHFVSRHWCHKFFFRVYLFISGCKHSIPHRRHASTISVVWC